VSTVVPAFMKACEMTVALCSTLLRLVSTDACRSVVLVYQVCVV
jgi:hypothetical protein